VRTHPPPTAYIFRQVEFGPRTAVCPHPAIVACRDEKWNVQPRLLAVGGFGLGDRLRSLAAFVLLSHFGLLHTEAACRASSPGTQPGAMPVAGPPRQTRFRHQLTALANGYGFMRGAPCR